MDVRNLELHPQSELCSDVTNVTSYFVLTISVRTETKNICLNRLLLLLAWLNKQPLFWHRQQVKSNVMSCFHQLLVTGNKNQVQRAQQKLNHGVM